MEAKKQLAREIVETYHTSVDGQRALDEWEQRFSARRLDQADLPAFAPPAGERNIISLVVAAYAAAAGIEMLRLALADRQSPWEQVLLALTATLPELDGEGVDAVRKLVEAGPPQEEVGLEGYALDPRLNASATFPTIRVGADS